MQERTKPINCCTPIILQGTGGQDSCSFPQNETDDSTFVKYICF